MNSFCPYCDDLKDIKLDTREEEVRVKGMPVKISAEYSICHECENVFYSMDQEERNINAAYALYREANGLLTPRDIKDIREKYSMKQRQFARLLGWSETIISQYETGRIPDRAHNDELMLLQDPKNMMLLYRKNVHLLKEKERTEVGERIRIINMKPRLFEQDCEDLVRTYFDYEPNMFSGNRKFSIEKFVEVIVAIVSKTGGIWKTSLNKLPFYIDFLHFKYFKESMTGMQYVKIDFGPVPDKYEMIFGLLKSAEILECTEAQAGHFVGEKFTTSKKPNYENFSEREIEIMDRVIDMFREFEANQIRDYSHEEDAYKKTEKGKPIDYGFAASLRLEL